MHRWGILLVAIFASATAAQAREWTDATGAYQIEGDLLGFDDTHVVVRRGDGELGMFKIAELSADDRAYLASREAAEVNDKNLDPLQEWTTVGGRKLTGRVVGHAQRELRIERRRGRTYVNDRRLTNLPAFYRELLPEVIEHFDGVAIPNERALQNWLRSQRHEGRTFALEGVLLESADGDEFLVPFFVFAPRDRKPLQAGWAHWLATGGNAHESSDGHAFRLEAAAAAHLRNQQEQRQIAIANLNLQAIQSGLTSAWEVTLFPQPGNPLPPQWVVSLGRDSSQATAAALHLHPGFVAGAVRRVSR